ncbi:forkhead box protein H1-like isoform X2 [Coregonus clupeaformis]|uniref:forkhead box protein H1-like isoform X2 n=1 Tax=Coregonus clupeaformis TaxID=59861 RepID=UPI001E1C3D14|nr:forkhead box protein H1-like isoform X2 [Coregonus clupeaformis]
MISMTKHWRGQSLLAPPAFSYLRSPSLGGHHDHQLDFQIHPLINTARSSPAQHGPYYSTQVPVQQPPRLEKPVPAQFSWATAPMDKAMLPNHHGPPGSSYQPSPKLNKDGPIKEESWDQKKNANSGKKKNYQRYPKPPYSYLAMIAMVIQNSPEKKLTLSEILKEISTLFPFFKGNYKGWRDSVLKDPGKPQGKGNFWAVEVSRVPVELLKRQNTAVSRQDETIFAQDLAPYILHGHQHKPNAQPPAPPPPIIVLPRGPITTPPPGPPFTALPPMPTRQLSPSQEDLYRPKLDSSFAIDSLLHSLRPASDAGEPDRDRNCWGVEPHTRPSPPPCSRYSSSARSASASSVSPASSSDEDWRGVSQGGKRVPEGEAGSDGYEDCRPPPHKAARRGCTPPWELPTSYAKYTPPNAVAPPSMRFNGGPLMPLGMPLYGYGGSPVTSSHFVGHAYWPLLPSGHPPLIMDLDTMLQSVPPNKSVFDVLGPANQSSHQSAGQYTLQSGPPLRRYPHY